MGVRVYLSIMLLFCCTNLFALKPHKNFYKGKKENTLFLSEKNKLLSSLGIKGIKKKDTFSILYNINIPVDVTNLNKSLESLLNKYGFLFFNLKSPSKYIELERTQISKIGITLFFKQKYHGIDIEKGGITLFVDRKNFLKLITNNLFCNIKTLESGDKVEITRDDIDSIIQSNFGKISLRGNILIKETILENNGLFYRTFKVSLPIMEPVGDVVLFIDRSNGRIVKREDILKRAETPKGRVFHPNKIVSAEMITVPLTNLFNINRLEGKFVTVKNSVYGNAFEPSGIFFYPDLYTDPSTLPDHLVEVMSYYHINNYKEYLTSLAINGLDDPTMVDAAYSKQDDSFFSPITKFLYFGTGGVPDAYDADIILHEFGHSIMDSLLQYPMEITGEPAAIEEAISDYLSASFFMDDCIGEWDSISYSSTGCMRRLKNDKKYPIDLVYEIHEDSLIFSGTLWKIWEEILTNFNNNDGNTNNRNIFDSILLHSLHLMGPGTTFNEAATLIIETEKMLTNGLYEQIIKNYFYESGIIDNQP